MKNILIDILADPQFPEDIAWKRGYFQTNDTIIKEGEMSQSLYLIEEGQLQVTRRVELEKHRSVRTGICNLGRNDFFGETSLFESQLRTASVIATTDGCLLEINGQKLNLYLAAHPTLGYSIFKYLFKTIIERLNQTNHKVEGILAWGLKVHGIEQHLQTDPPPSSKPINKSAKCPT